MVTTYIRSASLSLLVAGAVTTGLVLAAGQGPERAPADVAKKAAPAKPEFHSKPAPAAQPGGIGGVGASGTRDIDGGFGGPGDESDSVDEHRREIAELAAALAVWDKNPQNEPIFKALDAPLAMSFASPTPLAEVLRHIRSSAAKATGSPLPLYVDPRGLEDAEVTMDSKVIVDLEGVPLKTSLRLTLKQLNLAYCVRDGVVIISTVQGVREELAESARELIGSGKYNDVIDMRVLHRTGVLSGMRMGGMGGAGMMGGGMR